MAESHQTVNLVHKKHSGFESLPAHFKFRRGRQNGKVTSLSSWRRVFSLRVQLPSTPPICGHDGTGRHARMRVLRLLVWEFESPWPHHLQVWWNRQTRWIQNPMLRRTGSTPVTCILLADMSEWQTSPFQKRMGQSRRGSTPLVSIINGSWLNGRARDS